MSYGNDGYDDFLESIADGDPRYLECPNSHGSLPPRRVCPACGSRDLSETPLTECGVVESHTRIEVPPPRFAEDAPYTTAVVDFGPVSVTGQLRGLEYDAVEPGTPVGIDVDTAVTTGDRVIVFRPR